MIKSISLNPDSLLVPNVFIPASDQDASASAYSVPSTHNCNSDLPVMASPERGSSFEESSSSDSNESSCAFFPGTRNNNNIVYTDSESEPESSFPDVERWKERPLKCIKYVDDCLSLEKICFGREGVRGEERRIKFI